MRHFVSFLCLLCVFGCVDAASAEGTSVLTLVRDSNPTCTIVTAAQPTPAARLAGLELQYHLLQATGAEVPIRTDADPVQGTRILVGESAATRALGLDAGDLAPQEYRIVFRPDAVVLFGRDWQDTPKNRAEFGRPMSCGDSLADTRHKLDYWKTVGMPERSAGEIELPGVYDEQSTCYAVYDFLERYLGARWYGPGRSNLSLPAQKSLEVRGTDLRRAPALKYRDYLMSGNWPFMREQWGPVTGDEAHLFWRRLRLGGEKWAGNHTFHPKTIQGLLSDPEFQAVGSGKGTQLCYTNEKLIARVAQMAREYFDGAVNPPEGWKAVGDFFALVPDDNIRYCQCKKCQDLISSGSKMWTGQFSAGAHSNYFFYFVNAVAREVAKTHPDKYIATLAYWSYAYPPRAFEMEPNVSVAPCLHTCMYAIHKEMRENDWKLYEEWLTRTTAPIYLWNYYHHPMEPALIDKFKCFPNIMVHNSAESMRKFIRDGIRGIFICGEQDMLESYVIAKLWDDPAQDLEALLQEFFTRYFGAAAQPMKQFYTRIEAIATDPANYPSPHYKKNGIDWKNVAWTQLGTAERMEELGKYISAAEAAPLDDTEKEHVARWRKALWQWMSDGRAEYLSTTKSP